MTRDLNLFLVEIITLTLTKVLVVGSFSPVFCNKPEESSRQPYIGLCRYVDPEGIADILLSATFEVRLGTILYSREELST
jgi:hypothetical protein